MLTPMSTAQPPGILRLFLTFLRLGVTAFGGPAMVAYIRREAVERQQWLDSRRFDDGVALCQMLPGATAMQTAAYVGLTARGLAGALASYLGFGLPAFGLMLLLAAGYVQTRELPAVAALFQGLTAVVVAIVAHATWSFGERSLRDLRRALLAVAAAVLFARGIPPFVVIPLAALAGLLLATTPAGVTNISGKPSRAMLWLLAGTAAGFGALWWLQRPLFDLAALMFRIDLLAFGGGYASVPLMLHEVVNVRHWLDDTTFLHGILLGQVTPGPIVITATFVGYLAHGLPGAVIATVGVFLPSFLLVVGTTPYFHRLGASPLFNRLVAGAFCSFIGLLLSVTVHFATAVQWNALRLALALAALVALRLKANILWVVLAGVLVSLVFRR